MAEKNADNTKNIDDDILQCKADILRAGDVVPPYPAGDDTTSIPIETILDGKKPHQPAEEVKNQANSQNQTGRQTTDIPRFDLAEQIMAGQRKITAVKRKAPGKKEVHEKLNVESIGIVDEPKIQKLSEKDRVIAEIVARDIEKLRRRDN